MTERPTQQGGLSPTFSLEESVAAASDNDDILPKAVDAANRVVNAHNEQVADLEYEATHDYLTGLLDRRGFEKALKTLLANSQSVGILYLDADKFKLINDTRGHAFGDGILVGIAGKIRDSDIAGRFGGDEFVVAVDLEVKGNDRRGTVDLSPRERLGLVQEKIQQTIEEDPELKKSGLGVSVGAILAREGVDAATLLNEADQAMYAVKQQKKSGNSG
jgi:diguanylate cyclase (GGDEF)-like protein